MKKTFYTKSIRSILIVWFIMFSLSGHCLIVFFNYANFKSTDSTAYTELYFKIPISTVSLLKNANGKYEASVLITYMIKQKDSVLNANSYTLVSPELPDTNHLDFALLDLKRVLLKQGVYSIEIEVIDNNNPKSKTEFTMIINNLYKSMIIELSDIQLADTIYSTKSISKFTRNNYDIIPNVFNTYATSRNHMFFYSELYNSDMIVKDKYFYIRYFLTKDSTIYQDRQGILKVLPGKIIPVYGQIDISQLLPGMYNLEVEVISTQNKLLFSKTKNFSMQKEDELLVKTMGLDTKTVFENILNAYSLPLLKQTLDYLYFYSDRLELEESKKITNTTDSIQIKNYISKFWLKKYPENPAQEWVNFLSRVEQCNKLFSSGLRKGYLTDKGRVYLQYGPPNHIVEATDPSISYPYEIWHYYKLTPTQSNKKFVFFNFTGALNEFTLLHSNATGEPQNPDWKQVVKKYNKNIDTKNRTFGDNLEKDFLE